MPTVVTPVFLLEISNIMTFTQIYELLNIALIFDIYLILDMIVNIHVKGIQYKTMTFEIILFNDHKIFVLFCFI